MTWEVEHIGPHTLYRGDCREVLPTLADVDAVITDPPYGIAYRHGGGGAGAWHRRHTQPIVGDQTPFDPTPWLRYGNVLVWGADHCYPFLPAYGRFLVWNKLGHLQPWDNFCDVEIAWHSRHGAARLFSLPWKGIIRLHGVQNGDRHWHPSEKPIALMRWCIEQAGMPMMVLDPYMGSGTTGVACVQLGCTFTGVEIAQEYFDIACQRLHDALAQPDLFVAPPAPVQQRLLQEEHHG